MVPCRVSDSRSDHPDPNDHGKTGAIGRRPAGRPSPGRGCNRFRRLRLSGVNGERPPAGFQESGTLPAVR